MAITKTEKQRRKKLWCKNSPTLKHKLIRVDEDRTRMFDWGCIPGWYCLHCDYRQFQQ